MKVFRFPKLRSTRKASFRLRPRRIRRLTISISLLENGRCTTGTLFAETHRLRISDVERDQESVPKALYAIRESRIASSPSDKIKSFAQVHSAGRPAYCADSKLVVLVLEQDVACMIETRLLPSSLAATPSGLCLLSRRFHRFGCRCWAESAGFTFWNF
jgi:hypothetical protein